MKAFLYSIAIVSLIITLASCGESGNKLNDDQPSTSTTTKPSASDAANFQVDMSERSIAFGKATYIETCAPCHGAGGKGDGPAAAALNPRPRDHTNGAYMDKLTNGHIFSVVKMGGAPFGYPGMPAQPQLSDDNIKHVIAFVRSLSSTYHKP